MRAGQDVFLEMSLPFNDPAMPLLELYQALGKQWEDESYFRLNSENNNPALLTFRENYLSFDELLNSGTLEQIKKRISCGKFTMYLNIIPCVCERETADFDAELAPRQTTNMVPHRIPYANIWKDQMLEILNTLSKWADLVDPPQFPLPPQQKAFFDGRTVNHGFKSIIYYQENNKDNLDYDPFEPNYLSPKLDYNHSSPRPIGRFRSDDRDIIVALLQDKLARIKKAVPTAAITVHINEPAD